jgi:protein-tyrosine-phosphatase/tRNA A37 threonylcarbamoyladenosine synthetase subunit TsaC/SUA5/YrdC
MPEIFDWQRVVDPHAVIHHAVQLLRQGRTVAFPSGSGYVVTASALVSEAVGQLSAEGEALSLAVRGASEVRDWVPALSPLGQRLARRLWPGAVTLIVGGDLERGLASRLPQEVRLRLCGQGTLRLAMPQHEALRELLRHLPGPLLMREGQAETQADVIVADDPPAPQPATVVAVNGNAWEIVRPGAVSAEQIRERSACRIVFVCTGNTCRSPLAEALCKKQLADRLGCAVEELPARGYHVVSAGLAASAGGPAAGEAEQVARGYGGDLSAHRSQPLTAELAASADYLVGMTYSHVHALTDYFGSAIVAPRLLDPAGDIADPIGREQAVYDECGQQIWQQLESLVAEILPSEASQP